MAIAVSCGACGVTFNANDEFAGLAIRCPRCRTEVKIPAASGLSAAPPLQEAPPPKQAHPSGSPAVIPPPMSSMAIARGPKAADPIPSTRKRRRARKPNPAPFVVGGIAALTLLLAIILYAANSGRTEPEQVAQNEPADNRNEEPVNRPDRTPTERTVPTAGPPVPRELGSTTSRSEAETPAAPLPPEEPTAPRPGSSGKVAREESPTLTAPIFNVEEEVGKYVGKCMYFDSVWVSGDVEKEDDEFTVSIKDDRGKRYSGFKGIRFVCSKAMADNIRQEIEADSIVKSRICCAIYERGPKKNSRVTINGKSVESFPIAEIYKVEIYSVADKIIKTIRE